MVSNILIDVLGFLLFQDSVDGMWHVAAIDAIVEALRGIDTIMVARLKQTPQQTLVQQITSITGTYTLLSEF